MMTPYSIVSLACCTAMLVMVCLLPTTVIDFTSIHHHLSSRNTGDGKCSDNSCRGKDVRTSRSTSSLFLSPSFDQKIDVYFGFDTPLETSRRLHEDILLADARYYFEEILFANHHHHQQNDLLDGDIIETRRQRRSHKYDEDEKQKQQDADGGNRKEGRRLEYGENHTAPIITRLKHRQWTRQISHPEWVSFVKSEVVPRFPDGFTVKECEGYYQMGTLIEEDTSIRTSTNEGTNKKFPPRVFSFGVHEPCRQLTILVNSSRSVRGGAIADDEGTTSSFDEQNLFDIVGLFKWYFYQESVLVVRQRVEGFLV